MLHFSLRILISTICCLLSLSLYNQVPTFQKAYGIAYGGGYVSDVIATSGGYVLAGVASASVPGPDDKPLLMKIGTDGSLIWLKHYGMGYQTYLTKVIEANDDGFLAAGSSAGFNTPGNKQIFIVKTDTNGVLQWQQMIPGYIGNGHSDFDWVHPVPGGYIISGRSSLSDGHTVLIRIDNQGNTVWSKRFFYNWGERPNFPAFSLSGDTIFAVGRKDTFATFNLFDAVSGNPLYNRVLDGPDGYENELLSLAPAANGDWMLAGSVSPPASKPIQWVCRVSRTGDLQWSKIYPNVGYGAISPLSDGNFLLVPRRRESQSANLDPMLVKIDGNGEVLWSYQYALSSSDAFYTAIETPDGGILAAGFVVLPDQHRSALVVKTDADGLVTQCCKQPVNTSSSPYPVSPSVAVIEQVAFDTTWNLNIAMEPGSLNILDYCPPVPGYKEVYLCPGDSIVIDGIAYTSAGQVSSTVSGLKCDTNIVYNIVADVNPTLEKTIVFCPGDTIFLHGNIYTQPIVFTQAIPSVTGRCDTLVTYTLEYEPLDSNSTLQLTCPANISVSASGPVAVSYAEPVAASDCACPDIALLRTDGGASESLFPIGLNTVCYRAADACGQSKTCCFSVSVEADGAACDVKNIGCLRFELLQVNRDAAQNWAYQIRLTNTCADAVRYAYLQVPDGLQALAPIDNIIYTTPNGHTYTVRNPNFSPFYSVRFHFAGTTLAGGQSEVFRYVLPAQADVDYIHVAARLASGAFVEAYLNTFYCPVGTESLPKPEAGERSASETSGALKVYPNPVSYEEVLTIKGSDVEGSDFALRDLTGRVVLETRISGSQVLLGNVHLPKGIYFFSVRKNGSYIGSGKIVSVK